ncbi:hypothetical protein L5515_016241 [Caenorhabditis briggsae]|uniref:Uncharacterized protein n=1 Tax=Caenorhabditis briggsae TaxID=6238 RepID=A0AAE9JR12_CAEBR|nr:hypothetical protein L3Y34_010348 [Caenorhabditis briggsae]UMM39018.1 hypothetical protein L5515_016241 [Caenorhabditis briggsae]
MNFLYPNSENSKLQLFPPTHSVASQGKQFSEFQDKSNSPETAHCPFVMGPCRNKRAEENQPPKLVSPIFLVVMRNAANFDAFTISINGQGNFFGNKTNVTSE